tara:strand:+ start:396 stop:983 length:588 start_codon:yes stop_codon:yes gene_type:complete
VAINNIQIKGIDIPTSAHPEIKKLKKKYNVHSLHGNKVWNSTFVLIDLLDQCSFLNENVADLGCGWGVLSSYLQKKGASVTGYDADKTVKPYFDLVSKLMDVNPKFKNIDIFSKDLPMSHDVYIACDVCFWEGQIDNWITLIEEIVYQDKQLIMCDPGRESFWDLLKKCQVPHIIERKFINEPRKTDAYIVMFGS